MVATAPGLPKTSNRTCLGLYLLFSIESARGHDTTSVEPKMPCSRSTPKPATATTSTVTITVQRRLITLPIENLFTHAPFDCGRGVVLPMPTHG